MDPTKIIESLKGLQSAHSETREQAEKVLSALSNHEQFSGALLNILKSGLEDGIKLPAAIALKESQREQDKNIHQSILHVIELNWRSKPIW